MLNPYESPQPVEEEPRHFCMLCVLEWPVVAVLTIVACASMAVFWPLTGVFFLCDPRPFKPFTLHDVVLYVAGCIAWLFLAFMICSILI